MKSLIKVVCVLIFFCAPDTLFRPTMAEEHFAKLWPLEALKRVPKASWGKNEGIVREVYYESLPFRGKPTRVFAYYARPQEGRPPSPGIVLVHGGGGRAFAEWARLWAGRGYAALAMDTNGRGPDGKHIPDGGPEEDEADEVKLRPFTATEAQDMWTFQAVAAVIVGHSWLAAQPEVDPNRTGITGISWGGYLTLIATGLDDRFKVSVPVYGCGFLHENSYWVPQFERMPEQERRQWVEFFDPSRYVHGIRCPILFINGTTDPVYPLDSYQKTYQGVPGHPYLSIRVGMTHSHEDGWSPPEIHAFVDSILKTGIPLPELTEMERKEGQVSARFESKVKVERGQLHFTGDPGAWEKRVWQSSPAEIKGQSIVAKLPEQRPLVFFLSITDQRGLTVTTAHQELKR
jgi:dienelactone hydrolase